MVNEENVPLGTLPKPEVHSDHTPLHRGFSVFLFDAEGRVLLQQRSHHKRTWPLVWSGSCCGHPGPDESVEHAIRRRAEYELGITEIVDLVEMLPTFRYRCVRDGIVENEICPVWVGKISRELLPNPLEVESYVWESWDKLSARVAEQPGTYSEWCELEVAVLNTLPAFVSYDMPSNEVQKPSMVL